MERGAFMSKIAVVFWSGTGNTQEMANQVAAGAKDAGAEVGVFTADSFNADMADTYDAIAFGCPSMGAEELEESEFAPMWESVEPKLKGKRIGLFGSYGWGDGEWMRTWEEDCANSGLTMPCDYVICNETPDNEAKEACQSMGKLLAG